MQLSSAPFHSLSLLFLTFLGGVELLRQCLHLLLQRPVLLLRPRPFFPNLGGFDAGVTQFLMDDTLCRVLRRRHCEKYKLSISL